MVKTLTEEITCNCSYFLKLLTMPFCGVWYIVVNNNLKNKVEKTWVFFPFKFVYSLRSDVSYFLSRTRAGIIRPVQSFFPQLMTDRSAKVAPTVFHP